MPLEPKIISLRANLSVYPLRHEYGHDAFRQELFSSTTTVLYIRKPHVGYTTPSMLWAETVNSWPHA